MTSSDSTIRIEDKFLFDLNGFLILRGSIDRTLCGRLLAAVTALEAKEYPVRLEE